jgi:hypothetical protein
LVLPVLGRRRNIDIVNLMAKIKVSGGLRVAVCLLLACTIACFWFHSSFRRMTKGGSEGQSNSNTLIFRRIGIAIASWRGRLAIGHMDHPEYELWNSGGGGADRENVKLFGGLAEYQAGDDARVAWDDDFEWFSPDVTSWRLAGFAFASHIQAHVLDYWRKPTPIHVHTICFAIPDYLIFLLLMVYPLIWLRRSRIAKSRLTKGLCWKCGYDLRATLGHCPECGIERQNGTPKG